MIREVTNCRFPSQISTCLISAFYFSTTSKSVLPCSVENQPCLYGGKIEQVLFLCVHFFLTESYMSKYISSSPHVTYLYDYKYHIPIYLRKWALKSALIFTIMSSDRSLLNFNYILLYVIRNVSTDKKFHFF